MEVDNLKKGKTDVYLQLTMKGKMPDSIFFEPQNAH